MLHLLSSSYVRIHTPNKQARHITRVTANHFWLYSVYLSIPVATVSLLCQDSQTTLVSLVFHWKIPGFFWRKHLWTLNVQSFQKLPSPTQDVFTHALTHDHTPNLSGTLSRRAVRVNVNVWISYLPHWTNCTLPVPLFKFCVMFGWANV